MGPAIPPKTAPKTGLPRNQVKEPLTVVATTINGSLTWLRGRPVLGAVLGGIAGPMSYEAGIRMGAGSWVAGSEIAGFILVGVVWAVAIPLFFYWDRVNQVQPSQKSVNSA